ncbi:hypothetical protein HRbin31_00596 [bacterium HR31]|nr:hypothetical protein HRbin31_00596 [bacterium HR31]
MGVHEPARGLQVPPHAVGVHPQPRDHLPELAQHVVQQRGGSGEDDALVGGVGDVPLAPQGLVLQGRDRAAPQHAAQPHHPLAQDGVALVGHGGRPRLARGEGLLQLPDLRALQGPHLRGDALEAAAHYREGGHVVGVPVPLDHLGGGRVRRKPQPGANVRLHLRRQVRVVAHLARQLADPHVLPRLPQALPSSLQLCDPRGHLAPEADGFCLDPVSAAGHQGVAVAVCQLPQGFQQPVQLLQQQVRGPHEEHRGGGVHHVRRPQAAVQVAGVLA